MKLKKKKLIIKVKELTSSKHRKLRNFCEKGNEGIDIENITYNDQTKLTHLWVNMPDGYGNCWLPLDGCLSEKELERIERVKIIGGHNRYGVLLFFKKNIKKITTRTHDNRTMSVASVRFLGKLRCDEIPPKVQKIKRNIPLSRVYEISTGRYAGCYAIKVSGYWSPPSFRTNFDCGVYDGEGNLMYI